jgi:hypothetical protein
MDYMRWARGQWDRVTAVLVVLGGLLALLLGWIGVSGSAYAAGQLPYVVSGGLLGIFLLGVGGTLWLSADLRDEWRKLDRVEEALLTLAASAAEPTGTVAATPAAALAATPAAALAAAPAAAPLATPAAVDDAPSRNGKRTGVKTR